MPPSLTSCEITEPRNMWQVILSTPGIISGNITQCTDKVFSGHTAIFTLSFLLWHMYATHWAFIAYSMVHTIAGILSVLMVRYHYTVDVIIGFLMVCLIHRTYFTSLDLAVRQRRYNDYATVPQEMAENHRDQASNSTDSDSSIPFGSREDSFDVYKLEVITQSLNCIDSDGSSTLHGKDSAIISNSSNYNASINVGAHTPTALSYPAANHSDIQEMIERSASISKKRETSISTASSVANGKIENPNLMLQESKQQAHNNPDIKNASILVNHPANADPHYITQNSIEIAAPHITTTSSMATGGSNTSQFVATCVKYEEEGAGNAADEQLLPQSATPRDTQTEQTSWSQFEDNNYLSSNIFNQGDYVGMMGVNRSPGTLLPRIVAWMDGLDLRYK
ncbi:hypothetical protein GGI25_003393 [Coemansia spiralis]|uniref:Sphingomyelin synthase-like domain-containing protein n=2 Tax=Coemansia TaxID=4863 RepID=A0A9W8G268_9FUNG|nr:hypothetical protein EDC05_003782 [Coemansia umbellata]KAJ2621711.1 hypothetical protein GGI26_003919 [Coemansia sp. RSA 1358]KAJ2676858.1 hypothetical protein GGI25_003393 [Coemansia spiralis]